MAIVRARWCNMRASSAHDIPELDRKGLREFGLLTGGIVAVLFGLGFPFLLDHPLPVWPWAVFAILAAWALVAPLSMRPLYRGWMRFGLLLNRITTPLVLGILFFIVFTPIALAMRLLGRDTMMRKFEPDAKSYRVSSHKHSKQTMERPF